MANILKSTTLFAMLVLGSTYPKVEEVLLTVLVQLVVIIVVTRVFATIDFGYSLGEGKGQICCRCC
jgi:hypothetical protein